MKLAHTFNLGFLLTAWLAVASAVAQDGPDPELREVLRSAASDTTSFEDRFHAEVWLTDMSRRLERQVRDPEERIKILKIMPFWLDEIGRPDDNLLHIHTNLRYGCTILKFYLDKEDGDLRRALGRYNGSLGKRKYPNKVIDKLTTKWFQA